MSYTAPSQPRKETKYAFYPDATTRAYQERLRRGTNVKFADFLRASVALIAASPELEAQVFAKIGGSYLPGTFDPTEPFVAPTEAAAIVQIEPEVAPSQAEAAESEQPESSAWHDEAAATQEEDDSGFWG